jgi:hypothetical protein
MVRITWDFGIRIVSPVINYEMHKITRKQREQQEQQDRLAISICEISGFGLFVPVPVCKWQGIGDCYI